MTIQEIREQVDAEFDCRHPGQALTRFVAANGMSHFRVQCRRCGAMTASVRKSELREAEMANAPTFDEGLAREWSRSRSERFEALKAATRDERTAWYDEHLASPEWAAKRRLVMKRANGVCEGCMCRPAAEVHHLTYERVGNEMLFDLVALCRECHTLIHEAEPAPV